MKHQSLRTLLCLVLAALLLGAALTLTGCGQQNETETTVAKTEAPNSETAQPGGYDSPRKEENGTTAAMEPPEIRTVIGEGKLTFDLDVVFSGGEKKLYTVQTDADTLDKALLENKLVEGDDTEYGLYIKTVCGETLDYNADGMYWAIYVDGEMAMTGASQIVVTEGAHYALQAEKG